MFGDEGNTNWIDYNRELKGPIDNTRLNLELSDVGFNPHDLLRYRYKVPVGRECKWSRRGKDTECHPR